MSLKLQRLDDTPSSLPQVLSLEELLSGNINIQQVDGDPTQGTPKQLNLLTKDTIESQVDEEDSDYIDPLAASISKFFTPKGSEQLHTDRLSNRTYVLELKRQAGELDARTKDVFWNSLPCKTDYNVKKCPMYAMWEYGAPPGVACDCAPLFKNPAKQLSLNAIKAFSEPHIIKLIDDYQKSVTPPGPAICPPQSAVKGTMKSSAETGYMAVVMESETLENAIAYLTQIAPNSGNDAKKRAWMYFHKVVEVAKRVNDVVGEDVDKMYDMYEGFRSFAWTTKHEKIEKPEVSCPKGPRMADMMLPEVLKYSPLACWLDSTCQPTMDDQVKHQCMSISLPFLTYLKTCLLLKGMPWLVPNLPAKLTKKEFKQQFEGTFKSENVGECEKGVDDYDESADTETPPAWATSWAGDPCESLKELSPRTIWLTEEVLEDIMLVSLMDPNTGPVGLGKCFAEAWNNLFECTLEVPS